jgi:hypothetical protein
MSEPQPSQPHQQLQRISLFDSGGLPWTAHLSLGWLFFLFMVTGGMAAIPISLCVGAWIRVKTRSALALLIYGLLAGMLLASACAGIFLPGPMNPRWTGAATDAVSVAAIALWFAGALLTRHQITRYYSQREGSEFRLSLALTLLLGVWYLNYRIRPEFPTDARSDLSSRHR